MNRTTLISALAVAALAVGGIAWVSIGGSTPATAASDTAAEETPITGITEMTLGNPDAPVKVTEYASFTCGHCGNFHTDSFKDLKADYIDTGKVFFTYREVYFDRAALDASLLARCGGSDKFFGISNLLYKGQSEWIRAENREELGNNLGKIGRIAGLSGDEITSCLADEDKAKTLVAWYQQNATADGVDSTPTFLINGAAKISGNNPSALKEAIDAALAE